MNKTNRTLVPASSMPAPLAPAAIDDGFIKSRIHTIRGEQMMLSSDLAELYDVEVKHLHRQVKRNQPRFPTDFVVHLSPDELKGLRCQIVTSNRGGDRYGLLAFTEQGVAMLSSVLKSDRAATVNVAIMRAFVAMRRALLSLGSMLARVEAMEHRQAEDEARQLTAQARNDENQTRNEERFDTIFKAMDGGDFPPQKIFYDGQLWDARAFVDRLVKSAKQSLVLVDNWATVETLDMLAAKQKGVALTVVTSEHRDRQGNPRPKILPADVARFNAQYPTLSVRFRENFHDRFLVVDDRDLYLIGASLKDLGRKCFGFTRMDPSEIAGLKARM